jgi:hypothetical protein
MGCWCFWDAFQTTTNWCKCLLVQSGLSGVHSQVFTSVTPPNFGNTSWRTLTPQTPQVLTVTKVIVDALFSSLLCCWYYNVSCRSTGSSTYLPLLGWWLWILELAQLCSFSSPLSFCQSSSIQLHMESMCIKFLSVECLVMRLVVGIMEVWYEWIWGLVQFWGLCAVGTLAIWRLVLQQHKAGIATAYFMLLSHCQSVVQSPELELRFFIANNWLICFIPCL